MDNWKSGRKIGKGNSWFWNSSMWSSWFWNSSLWNAWFWNASLRSSWLWNASLWSSCFWNFWFWNAFGWNSCFSASWKSASRYSVLWISSLILLLTACKNSNRDSNSNSSSNSAQNSNSNSSSTQNSNSSRDSNSSQNPNSNRNSKPGIVVFQTDFGLKDGAVSAMKGVAITVSPGLELYDLTHEIPPFNIWEGAYRLEQTAPYWPAGTVFVSVIDPGVGTSRKSVVMRSKSGHYFVTPDNGTLTLVAESLGIEEVREINEELNRRTGSGKSYTFHGRDVYAYTGARLAAGVISFEEVGNRLPDSVVSIPYQKAQFRGDSIVGNIPILDIQYGNVWTNINDSVFRLLQVVPGKNIEVEIRNKNSIIFKRALPFANTFGDVPEGKPLAYMNSLLNFSLAANMASFSDIFKVKSGPGWSIVLRKAH